MSLQDMLEVKGQDLLEICGAPNGRYDPISQGAANEFRIPLRLVTMAHRKVMKAILFPILYCNVEAWKSAFPARRFIYPFTCPGVF